MNKDRIIKELLMFMSRQKRYVAKFDILVNRIHSTPISRLNDLLNDIIEFRNDCEEFHYLSEGSLNTINLYISNIIDMVKHYQNNYEQR